MVVFWADATATADNRASTMMICLEIFIAIFLTIILVLFLLFLSITFL